MDEKIKCPKCGVESSVFDEKGQHNFCPSGSAPLFKIVEICIKCKMEEVIAKWKKA
jgi:hypothetical protein